MEWCSTVSVHTFFFIYHWFFIVLFILHFVCWRFNLVAFSNKFWHFEISWKIYRKFWIKFKHSPSPYNFTSWYGPHRCCSTKIICSFDVCSVFYQKFGQLLMTWTKRLQNYFDEKQNDFFMWMSRQTMFSGSHQGCATVFVSRIYIWSAFDQRFHDIYLIWWFTFQINF